MQIKRVPIDSIHLDPVNARLHGEVNLEAILGSLKRFGQAEPLVVQKSTGRIIGGNGRLVAMRKLGWTECNIVEVDVDDLTATALAIALNRTAELAEWDESTLARLLQELRAEDGLEGVGFRDEEIDQLLDELSRQAGPIDGLTDPDAIPEPPDAAVTKPGDLWLLGDHRLLCGDSSKPEDVDRLLAGAEIHLVNTDPPYNVCVEPRSSTAIAAGQSSYWDGSLTPEERRAGLTHHQKFDVARGAADPAKAKKKMRPKDRKLTNDFVSDEEFTKMLHAWFGNMARVLLPGRCFYIWGGFTNLGNYPPVLKEVGLYFAQAIVWDKEHPVLTRKDFMTAYELAYYGWRLGAGHKFFGPNNATDLWHVKKVHSSEAVHLTQKPTELATRAMQYSSRTGENVLDLFGGSGSTLIGAEQTNRRAFLMEIDPLYSDVILTRWQEFTGKKAVLEGTGQTFDEIRKTMELETRDAEEKAAV